MADSLQSGDGTGPHGALVADLAAVAQQDAAALRRLYDATAAKLLGVCLRILHDRAESEDVVQEVFVTVWRQAGRYDPQRATPMTWLATIARNRAIDCVRARRAVVSSGTVEDALADAADAGEAADRSLERSEELDRLLSCLNGLDAGQAASIRTAFFEGVTYETLAARDGAPLGTVKSRIRRGLIRLRACLDSGAPA